MFAGDARSPARAGYGAKPLLKSNGVFAAQLVLLTPASYSRPLLMEEGWERGGEWPRQGLGPNNNIDNTNKNNCWAAFVRPIFLSAFFSVSRCMQEPA
jgi:hypothetical protein